MKKLIVFNPGGAFVRYTVFNANDATTLDRNAALEEIWSGRFRVTGGSISHLDLDKLLQRYSPHMLAIRVLYGGDQFNEIELLDDSIIERLKRLTPESPLNIPVVIRLLNMTKRIVPAPDVMLFFETAFFNRLPARERTYAIDYSTNEIFGGEIGELRRYGYHGLYHRAALAKVLRSSDNARRVLSICLEPHPEVVGLYDGKPITVSGGATPAEGLPGNTNSGEVDPGLILFLEEKKGWGPERINELLTREGGMKALTGESVTVGEVLGDNPAFESARRVLEYRILLSCGSAIGASNGVDAIVFSGRYASNAEALSTLLVSRLRKASAYPHKIDVFFLKDNIEQLIAQRALRWGEYVNHETPWNY